MSRFTTFAVKIAGNKIAIFKRNKAIKKIDNNTQMYFNKVKFVS